MPTKRERRVAQRATDGVPSIAPEVMPPALNWAVMWLKGDRIIEKWCDDDFAEAMRVYQLALESGRKGVTLRSANYAFPPPKRYTEREVTKIVKKKVKGKVKRYKKKAVVNVMDDMNRRGWWWCPYCIKFRRFPIQDGFFYEDIFVPRKAHYCEMCGISHEHGTFKLHNPLWWKLSPQRRTRRGKANGKRRRRAT